MLQKSEIAIFHAFLKAEAKGGAEKLALNLRNIIKADFWVGGYDKQSWGKEKAESGDSFASSLHTKGLGFEYLFHESKINFVRQIKRLLFFLFSPKKKLINLKNIKP